MDESWESIDVVQNIKNNLLELPVELLRLIIATVDNISMIMLNATCTTLNWLTNHQRRQIGYGQISKDIMMMDNPDIFLSEFPIWKTTEYNLYLILGIGYCGNIHGWKFNNPHRDENGTRYNRKLTGIERYFQLITGQHKLIVDVSRAIPLIEKCPSKDIIGILTNIHQFVNTTCKPYAREHHYNVEEFLWEPTSYQHERWFIKRYPNIYNEIQKLHYNGS